jgi:hypothetical protein
VDAALVRAVGVLAALLMCAGCDTHEVRIAPPPAAAPGEPGDQSFTISVIGVTIIKDPLAETVIRNPLPLEVPISCLRREATGAMSRYENDVRTPLPWYQRFPADMISDPLPWTFTAHAEAAIELSPVPTADLAALAASARADGYARIDVRPQAHPPAAAPGTAP